MIMLSESMLPFRFCNKISRHIASNLFCRSTNIIPVKPLSKLFKISFVKKDKHRFVKWLLPDFIHKKGISLVMSYPFNNLWNCWKQWDLSVVGRISYRNCVRIWEDYLWYWDIAECIYLFIYSLFMVELQLI